MPVASTASLVPSACEVINLVAVVVVWCHVVEKRGCTCLLQFIRNHQVKDSLMKGALFPEDNGKVSFKECFFN